MRQSGEALVEVPENVHYAPGRALQKLGLLPNVKLAGDLVLLPRWLKCDRMNDLVRLFFQRTLLQ